MRENELRKILSSVCDGYVDNILDTLEEEKERKKEFPFLIACSNFLGELKDNNIIVELIGTFEDVIIDRIIREISNFLAR